MRSFILLFLSPKKNGILVNFIVNIIKFGVNLRQTGLEFDMLYDPVGWQVLLANTDKLDGEIMYIHQGGVLGNESMLPRYKRKYKDMA